MRKLYIQATLMMLLCSCGGEEGGEPPPAGPQMAVTVDFTGTIAELDEKFISFSVDASQLAGGNWWSPEGTTEIVPPYDFERPRLRRLAAELAPAYLRLGGSEADVIFYNLSDPPLDTIPEPYTLEMTREIFDRACDFAREGGHEIFFTLNAGPGPRDQEGRWTPDQARELIEYAKSVSCPVTVWELGNEINGFSLFHGGGFRVEGDEYALDMARARELIDEVDPGSKLAGPSSFFWPVIGEISPIMPDFMANGGELVDVVTWHYYPQQSDRCPAATRPAEEYTMMEPDNLDEVLIWAGEVESLSQEHAPQAEVWLGETGNAQCGGQRGISDRFVAGFWWLDQLGQMARRGHRLVVRQTLSGSDYQLIDEETLEPNPDYYSSLLFKRLMGTRVLDAGPSEPSRSIRAYAHCTPGATGALTFLVINLERSDPTVVTFEGLEDKRREVYSLTSTDLLSQEIHLNGKLLQVAADGSPPEMQPEKLGPYDPSWFLAPPASFSFVVFPDTESSICR